MTPRTRSPLHLATLALAVAALVGSWLAVGPQLADATTSPKAAPSAHATHAARHHARSCRASSRSVRALPEPRVGYQAPYVPPACDPMHQLPKQAWRLFACIRWREGGDNPNEANGAGMYQFTSRSTWDEFRGSFPKVPSRASALEQDIVAFRAWKTEQFFPWNGDPCLGAVHEIGKWGWY